MKRVLWIDKLMRHSCISIFIIAFTLFLSGCGSESNEDNFAEAKAAFDVKDYQRVQIICDHIATDTTENLLSCSELCRLSLLYMGLAEACPDSAAINVASAADILRKAYEISADSVADYFVSLPAEEVPNIQLVLNITGSMNLPPDSIFSEECVAADSIFGEYNHCKGSDYGQ